MCYESHLDEAWPEVVGWGVVGCNGLPLPRGQCKTGWLLGTRVARQSNGRSW